MGQPQTSEHLAAIEIMKLKHILILQNKIDLIKEAQAQEQHEQILKFIEGTVAEGAPVIPISAQLKYNIEVVCEYAVPGGLIGVGTKVDPTLCRADRMVGQVLGAVGHLPSILTEL